MAESDSSKGNSGGNSRTKFLVPIVVIVLILAGVGVYFAISHNSGASSLKEIKIGTLYASSGNFAASSTYEYKGLQLWVNETNANGGLYLSSVGKKLPLKLIAYDDQSSTTTATTDYTNLITQDHVNILIADFGSTLTAPAVTLAQKNHVLLFDATASSPSFFTANNPYIVDLSIRTSSLWPLALADYIVQEKANLSKVAILYSQQDFTAAQANTTYHYLENNGVNVVYYQSTTASSATEYATLVNNIAAKNPQAVLEFGYDTNDIAFFNALNSTGVNFNFTFAMYPGLEFSNVNSSVPAGSLNNVWTYGSPPVTQYSNVNLGPTTSQFVANWTAKYGSAPNFNNIAGYNTGLLVGKIVTTAGDVNQMDMRNAANTLSGNITTLEGPFLLNTTTGAQLGMPMTLMQYQLNSTTGKLMPVIIYPTNVATGSPVYPASTVSTVNSYNSAYNDYVQASQSKNPEVQALALEQAYSMQMTLEKM